MTDSVLKRGSYRTSSAFVPFVYVAPTPYTGPGDIVAMTSSIGSWWGLRAFSAATIGVNAVRLRRDSDNAEQTFVTISGGHLDLASIATFKGGANLFVVTLYDQVGVNHLTMATATQQPPLTLNAIGSLPAVGPFDNASQDELRCSSNTFSPGADSATTYNQISISVVLNTPDANQNPFVSFNSNNDPGLYVSGTNNTIELYSGVSSTAIAFSFNTWHTVQATNNSGGTDVVLDGVSNGGGTDPYDLRINQSIGYDGFGGYSNDMLITESGFWVNTIFSAGEKTAMDANQSAYWGF